MPRFLALFAFSLCACSHPDPEDSSPKHVETADTAADGLHGILDVQDGMQVLKLWGTREEMGYAEGRLMCHEMVELFQYYVLDHLIGGYGVPYDLVLLLAQNAPAIPEGDMRELEAMFQGAQEGCTEEELWIESPHLEAAAKGARAITFDDLIVANVIADYGCSSFSAWGSLTESGDTIHARNFDWAIDPQGYFLKDHVLKVYSSTEESGADFVSVFVPGIAGCVSCFTREGVGITMHNVGGLDATQSTGIYPRMLATRAALTATWQGSDPVAEADAILESAPQIVGSNLHISFPTSLSDGHGAGVYEYDGAMDHEDGQTTVREPGDDPELSTDDAIACTNHFVKRVPPKTEGTDSLQRLRTLYDGLEIYESAESGMDVEGAHALIGQVANQYTAHSVIMENATGRLYVYVPPETGVPATDADPVVFDLDELFADMP